jgi:hypothetical protein
VSGRETASENVSACEKAYREHVTSCAFLPSLPPGYTTVVQGMFILGYLRDFESDNLS